MQVIAEFFRSGARAALPVHGAAFCHYFKQLARFTKLATSYLLLTSVSNIPDIVAYISTLSPAWLTKPCPYREPIPLVLRGTAGELPFYMRHTLQLIFCRLKMGILHVFQKNFY